MKLWDDITKVNGKYVAKDVFKALAFIVGLNLCVAAVVGSFYDKDIDTNPALILIGLAFGMQGLKTVDTYFNRKTADSNGEPLTDTCSTCGAGSTEPTAETETPA